MLINWCHFLLFLFFQTLWKATMDQARSTISKIVSLASSIFLWFFFFTASFSVVCFLRLSRSLLFSSDFYRKKHTEEEESTWRSATGLTQMDFHNVDSSSKSQTGCLVNKGQDTVDNKVSSIATVSIFYIGNNLCSSIIDFRVHLSSSGWLVTDIRCCTFVLSWLSPSKKLIEFLLQRFLD